MTSPKKSKKKICIVTISLANGGAERSTAQLSTILTEKGYDIHIVSLTNSIDYEYSGKLICLYSKKRNSLFQRFYRFKRLLNKEKFDYIIDNRNRNSNFKEFFYLYFIYKNQRTIYSVHSYNLKEYFPSSRILTKKIIQKSKYIITVSKAIEKKINSKFSTTKSHCIYNSYLKKPIITKKTKSSEDYILFLGRIQESVKNLTLLLDGYKQSELSKKNIQLRILGDGPDLEKIKLKTKKLDLNKYVKFIPYTTNVIPYLKSAKFQVLTSRYEGFPMVLIESLSIGTPVISVDCKSGPSEIIKHKENGLLVENHNVKKLAEAFNLFIENEELFNKCKQNAQTSINHLSPELISDEWSKILI